MIAYIAHVVGFAAAAVAVFGETYHPNESGWKRITRLGWFVILFAFAGLGISMYTTYINKHQEREAAQRKDELGKLAKNLIIKEGDRVLVAINEIREKAFNESTDPDVLRLQTRDAYRNIANRLRHVLQSYSRELPTDVVKETENFLAEDLLVRLEDSNRFSVPRDLNEVLDKFDTKTQALMTLMGRHRSKSS